MSTSDAQKTDPNEDLKVELERLGLQKQIKDAKKALEDTPKVENPQLTQLQNTSEIVAQQKAIAENQQKIAEAQKATLAATFPKGETKPLEGKIETDEKFGYAAIPVAYQAIKEKAIEIASRINNLKGSKLKSNDKILIVSELDFALGDLPVFQVESGIELLNQRLSTQRTENEAIKTKVEQLKPTPKALVVGEALTAASSIVSTIADIIGYFQVDYTIKGQSFVIDNVAIQSAVASQINIDGVEVYIYNFGIIQNSQIVASFTGLLDQKKKLDDTTEQIKSNFINKFNQELKSKNESISKKEKEIADLKEKATQQMKDELQQAKDEAKPISDFLDFANTAVTNSEALSKAILSFAESVTKSQDEKTPPLLAKAALRKQIGENKITHLLYLKVLSSGGEAMTLKSRMSSGDTAFMGGGVISFVLATKEGIVLASDTYPTIAQLDYNLSDSDKRSYQNIPFIYKKKKHWYEEDEPIEIDGPP